MKRGADIIPRAIPPPNDQFSLGAFDEVDEHVISPQFDFAAASISSLFHQRRA